MSYVKFEMRPTKSPNKNSLLEKKLRQFRKIRKSLASTDRADFEEDVIFSARSVLATRVPFFH